MRSLCARPWSGTARLSTDDGFTLLESVIALVIVALVTSALAAAIVGGVRASLISRENQQAADFMTRALEQARQLDFASLGHLSTDIASGDSRINGCGANKCVDVGTGSEKLYSVTGAAIPTHAKTVNSNGIAFTISTYVTQVSGTASAELKRVTVYATWLAFGRGHTRRISSLVTEAQRGLPLPRYTFTTSTAAVTANPGTRITYRLRLLNQGAPDRWNLVLSGSASSWNWRLYQDVDADGLYTNGTDTLLTDTNGDGMVDTGRLDPTTDFPILAVYNSATTDPAGSKTLTVTATSVAQPTAIGASTSVNLVTTLTTGSVGPTPTPTPTTPTPTPTPSSTPPPPAGPDCTWSSAVPTVTKPNASYSSTTYSLHNGTAGSIADTTAQAVSSMSWTAAGTHAMAAMSTDVNAQAGRTVNSSTVTTDAQALALSDTRQFVDWKVSTPAKTDIGGTAVLKLWVGPVSGSLANPSLRVVAYAGTIAIGSWTGTVSSSCTGWQLFYVSVPLTSTQVAKNSVYGVRIVNTGAAAVRFGYDGIMTPASGTGGYDATFGLGVK